MKPQKPSRFEGRAVRGCVASMAAAAPSPVCPPLSPPPYLPPPFLQQVGRIHAAAFSDFVLHAELTSKATFWQQPNFYGVDLCSLMAPALDGYFSQVCEDEEGVSRHGTPGGWGGGKCFCMVLHGAVARLCMTARNSDA